MLPPLGGCRRLVATAWSRPWSRTRPTRLAEIALAQMADIFGDRAHLALTHRRRPGEAKRLHALDALARRHGLRSLATGDVLYDGPDKRMLQDVVTAIREHVTIDELGFRRERFADRHLKSPEEMERRFSAFPDAIRATADIAERCTFSLRELSYQYPDEIVMSGRSPQEALERLTWIALDAKFPDGVRRKRYRRAAGARAEAGRRAGATRPIS